MANIREIQSRINSVKDTMKIKNAMYMISSSKMTRPSPCVPHRTRFHAGKRRAGGIGEHEPGAD